MPYILEVTSTTKWKDLVAQVDTIISKLVSYASSSLQSTPMKDTSDIKISQSSIRVHLNETLSPSHSANSKMTGSDLNHTNHQQHKAYKIRVIKTDHYYENYCVFCKDEFIQNKRYGRSRICDGKACSFSQEVSLFEDQEFRNINDLIIFTVDWQDTLSEVPLFVNHPSCDSALEKS